MFVFLTIIVACFQTFQTKNPTPVSQQNVRLGFRFSEIPECYLVTEVLSGYGAEQAGLQVGDCIVSVDGETGDAAVNALRDATRPSVLVKYRPVLDDQTRQVSVRRGVYFADTPQSSVHPMLTSASTGQIEQMISMLDESIEYDVIEQATPLLARFYPQLFPTWLMALQERAAQDSWISGLLIQYYGQQQDWNNVLAVYQSQPVEVQQSWIRLVPSFSKVVAKAQWETDLHQEAIQLVRAMQPWTFETGLEQTVGLAPYSDTVFIDRQRKPSQANLQFQSISGEVHDLTAFPWTVMSFWATWCHPCQKEMPELHAWARTQSNVQVLAVNMNDNPSIKNVTKTLADWGIESTENWHNIIDQKKTVELQIFALPTLILFDSSGIEHMRVQGYLPEISQQIESVMQLNQPTERLARFRGASSVTWFDVPLIQDLARDGQVWWMLTDELSSSTHIETLLASALEPAQMSENNEQDRLIIDNGRVITVDLKHSVLRLVEGTEGRWFRTLPSSFVDAVWLYDVLVVALNDRVVLLNKDGVLLQTIDVSVQNLQIQQNQFNTLEVRMMIQGKQYRLHQISGLFQMEELSSETSMPKAVKNIVSSRSGRWVRTQDGQTGTLIFENAVTNQTSVLQSSEDFFEVFDAMTDTMWVVFPKNGVLQISSQIP